MTTRPLAIFLLVLVSFAAVADLPTIPTQAATVTGFVTTVSGNLITILNGAVTIDASGANFQKRDGSATIADVKPGSQIFAHLRNGQAPAGTLLQATTIIILDAPAGILNGPVQSVDVAGISLTMFGARIVVTPQTRIRSIRSREGTIADIKAGDHAAVEVCIVGSALVAESILVLPPLPPLPPISDLAVEGTVKSIGASSWVITTTREPKDVTIAITSSTKIDRTIKAGDSVVVLALGRRDEAGNLVAIAIMKNGRKRAAAR